MGTFATRRLRTRSNVVIIHRDMPTSTRMRTRSNLAGTTRSLATLAGIANCAFVIAQMASPMGSRGALAREAAVPDTVRASLVADVAAIQPGKPFRLAVRLAMADEWHVNWINPGDAGLAPSIAWKLPAGFRPGLLEWPLPRRFSTGPLVIFGYEGDVLLSADVAVPPDLAPGTVVELVAEVSWLACAEACVPGAARVSLRLPVEATSRPDAEWGARIASALRRCPTLPTEWNVEARVGDRETLLFDLQTAAATTPALEGVFFFPFDQGLIENASAQPLAAMPGPYGRIAYQLRVERAHVGSELPRRLTGILVCESGWTAGAGPQAITIDVPLGY
jgi:DsbC/DsbD-like thiol-disulfide interchange protein